MKRELTCIICPKGCSLTVQLSGQTVAVTGNSCPKGAEYAENECLQPVRTVTTTLLVANRRDIIVSVKTEKPVPKDKVYDVVKATRRVTYNAPLAIGDVVLDYICGTRMIATKAVR